MVFVAKNLGTKIPALTWGHHSCERGARALHEDEGESDDPCGLVLAQDRTLKIRDYPCGDDKK